jgi:peroxiredoxin
MKTMKNSSSKSSPFRFARTSLLIIAVIASMSWLTSCEEENDDQPDPIAMGDAPDFTLKSLAGDSVSLSDFENKVVVLFFFGNACPSCKAAAPSIESTLVTPYAERTDYMVLGLDQWNGNMSAVEGFKNATSVTFPLLMNASGVATNYGTAYDRLVVIDQAGDIVFSGTRGASSDVSTVKAKVDMLLGL